MTPVFHLKPNEKGIIEGFHAVKFMREVRDEFDRETAGMTLEEQNAWMEQKKEEWARQREAGKE